jgi:hypothetical protein
VHQQNDSALFEAFNRFREEFASFSKKEAHANLKHLLEAYTQYGTQAWCTQGLNYDKWDKLDLFWCQVIGFVQLYLPECDKQIFHQIFLSMFMILPGIVSGMSDWGNLKLAAVLYIYLLSTVRLVLITRPGAA